jgi:galactose mutarotase-like enzyme
MNPGFERSHVSHSGFAGWRLSNDSLSVDVVPELGARIVSLKNVRSGREWCWHPDESMQLFANDYGDSFADSPNVGFDECFPTIEACEWQGRRLPCHGEVWSVPWTLDEEAWEEGIVSTTVTCRQSPLELNRQVSIRGNQVQLDYLLHNKGDQPEAYLWAFHPMMRVNSDDRLELPEEVRILKVEGVRGVPENAPESDWSWPSPFAGFELDRFELGANEGASVKGFTGKLKECSARIASQANGEYFEISWEAEPNPFLGVWINRGAYRGFQHVAALEPTNSQTDFLNKHHMPRLLPAGAQCSWSMTITLGILSEINS